MKATKWAPFTWRLVPVNKVNVMIKIASNKFMYVENLIVENRFVCAHKDYNRL